MANMSRLTGIEIIASVVVIYTANVQLADHCLHLNFRFPVLCVDAATSVVLPHVHAGQLHEGPTTIGTPC